MAGSDPFYEDTPSDAEREQEDAESEDIDDEYEPEPYNDGYIGDEVE